MGLCSERFKAEFRLKNFLLSHEDPQTFVQFQCGLQWGYLVWRILWAIYHVVWIIITGVKADDWAGPDPNEQVKWFIYLTDLAYLSLTLSAIIDAIAVIIVFASRRDILRGFADELPWYTKMSWVFFNVANGVSLAMSILYWGLVYTSDDPMNAVNIGTHILNAVYVLLNVAVTGMPVRLFHFWHPMVFATAYVLFSLFYYLAGGTNHDGNPYIYSVLDWRKPGTSIGYSLAVILILVPVLQAVLHAIHVAKVMTARRCCRSCRTSEEFSVSDAEMTKR